MRICVVGAGYVGLSSACILKKAGHEVVVLENNPGKVEDMGRGKYIEGEPGIWALMKGVKVTGDEEEALSGSEFVFVAVPTDGRDECGLDTATVSEVVNKALSLTSAVVVVRSTVPIGYTKNLGPRVVFCPEFLREGTAVVDALYPSRVVVGGTDQQSVLATRNLIMGAVGDGTYFILTGPSEAEAIKLFSNAYLATRVAFFNDMDTVAMRDGLEITTVIEGVCADERIGEFYNNPSFGFGGYCLPKDTAELARIMPPNSLVKAVSGANELRKLVIAEHVFMTGARKVGVFETGMKKGSGNSRGSAVLGVIGLLEESGVEVVVSSDLDVLATCELVLANRKHPALEFLGEKVFTRDIFGLN